MGKQVSHDEVLIATMNLGSTEKTETSKYQIRVLDVRDKSVHPKDYPAVEKFFDTLDERNQFINSFEYYGQLLGGRFEVNERESHPLFKSFDIYEGNNVCFKLVVYL